MFCGIALVSLPVCMPRTPDTPAEMCAHFFSFFSSLLKFFLHICSRSKVDSDSAQWDPPTLRQLVSCSFSRAAHFQLHHELPSEQFYTPSCNPAQPLASFFTYLRWRMCFEFTFTIKTSHVLSMRVAPLNDSAGFNHTNTVDVFVSCACIKRRFHASQ